MNNKLLIGIIVVIVGLVIAAVILGGSEVLSFVHHLMLWIPLTAWIFMVWIVWRKRTKEIFHDQMEPKLAERRYRMLKAFLLLGGISYAMFWVSVLLGIAIFGPTEEDTPLFFIPFSIALLCSVGTIGFLVISFISLIGRQKTT